MLGPELEFPPCRTLWLANLPVWVTDSALRGLHLSLIKTHNSSTQGELYGRGGTRNTVGFITVGGDREGGLGTTRGERIVRTTQSGCVVTGHRGQVTASSMGNTGAVKSCTLNRSVLVTTGHNHDSPQKMMPLDNGGTATHSTAALPSRSMPRCQDCACSVALMNAGHEDCSRSVKYLSENQRYDSEKPIVHDRANPPGPLSSWQSPAGILFYSS